MKTFEELLQRLSSEYWMLMRTYLSSEDKTGLGWMPARIERLSELMRTLVKVGEMYREMRSAMGRIDGKRGLVGRLGISKNAIYMRLQSLGLTAEDFRDYDATIGSLCLKSSVVRRMLKEVLGEEIQLEQFAAAT